MPWQYHFPTFTNLIDFERLKFWALVIVTSIIYIILIENDIRIIIMIILRFAKYFIFDSALLMLY